VTQLDLLAPTRVPERGTQCYELLVALQRGERLTVAKAMMHHSVYALSQRMGELKRKYGWPIRSRMVDLGHTHVAEYWLELR
jgi:hypothetical protein